MDIEDDPTEIARLVLPGVIGVGVGTFVGLLLFDSLVLVAVVAAAMAFAGQLAGIYLAQHR